MTNLDNLAEALAAKSSELRAAAKEAGGQAYTRARAYSVQFDETLLIFAKHVPELREVLARIEPTV